MLCGRLGAGTRLMAAVKANAYGHGAVPVSRAVLAAGGDGLAVETAEEALELREAGIRSPILVMGPLFDESQCEALAAEEVEFALVSRDVVKMVANLGDHTGAPLCVHIKIDTGMNRHGLLPGREVDEALAALRGKRRIKVAGVMTHFASAADHPDSVAWQLARFLPWVDRVRRDWPAAHAHAANSAATLRHPESHLDMVRCGIAVYGLSPFQNGAACEGLEPALSWHSEVCMVKRIDAGEGVGYGLTFRPSGPQVMALVPVGYADGLPWALGNRGEVLIRGRRRRMAGRVSMDSFAVDLGDNADGVVAGDRVTLIGTDGPAVLGAEEVASWAGTISYEITCGIKARRAQLAFVYPRRVTEES